MLTVYSTQGSPGASTTAMHLAAHWASTGREVLLIEADPAGGTLSHNLGIQFTPGSASFVASRLPVLSNHLIDHAQDVLFENLHVMPAPASPTGARGIFHTFVDYFEDLRTISENEIAVIIDGGRITADTVASGLTTGAAGVAVVCRSNSQLSSLEHLKDVLTASPDDGPQGCVVTIGNSPMDPEEWHESHGLTFCGSIEILANMATDLSAYLDRKKRKSKKWWTSLEQVGEKLYQYAQPPASDQSRRTKPPAQAPPPTTGPDDDAGPAAAAASEPLAAEDPAPYGQAPPAAPQEPMPAYGQALPMATAPGPDYGQPHDLPPDGAGAYGQPPPPYPPAQYPAPPYEQPQPGTYEAHPPQQPAPPYEQPQPGTYEAHPPQQPAPPYEQPQPGTYEAHPPQQPAPPYEQPQPGTYEAHPPQHPAPPYEQPQPGTYEAHPPQHHPAPPYEQPQPGTYEAHPPQHPAPPYEQPPARPEHPTPVPPEAESPPRPNMEPTGSFREWAVKLHGPNAGDAPAENRGG